MYIYEARIRYSELDQSGRLRLDALLNYFQDSSTFHSEDIGLGIHYLLEKQLIWVMSSWQIVVERYPLLGERVTIGTAPYDFKGFIGYRNFVMIDERGVKIAYANTIWSLLDTETGKPVRPPEDMLKGYVLEPKLDMIYAKRRIPISEGAKLGEGIVVGMQHLDTNHHVNNVQFVKIAIECLPKVAEIKQLRAEYKRQAVLGDILFPKIALQDEGTCVIALQDIEGNLYCVVELA